MLGSHYFPSAQIEEHYANEEREKQVLTCESFFGSLRHADCWALLFSHRNGTYLKEVDKLSLLLWSPTCFFFRT